MIKNFSIIFILTISIILVLLFIFQRHLIYAPSKIKPSPSRFHAEDMQVVSIITQDKINLNAWYKPAKPNKPTMIFLHGNAGHIGYRMPWIRDFINSGFGVLLFDYRGYGGNKGSPTERGLYLDGEAAMQYLLNLKIKNNDIILYGESLGTAVATHLAIHHQVLAIILQSPFTSISKLAQIHYPWLPIKPWDQYNSLENIKKIHAPILFIHGESDNLVPISEGKLMYESANQPKYILVLKNKNHNDLWSLSLYNEIEKFVSIVHYPRKSS